MYRILLATALGLLFGIFCAWMATIRKPVEITFYNLLAAVYVRTLAGFFIGAFRETKLVESKYLNALVRGILIGFGLSTALSLPWGPNAVIGFGLFGAIYGAIIDITTTKFYK